MSSFIADCGCWFDTKTARQTQCSLHGAASELLAACRLAVRDHHENCDVRELGPDLEPSTKPCDCHVGPCKAAIALAEGR